MFNSKEISRLQDRVEELAERLVKLDQSKAAKPDEKTSSDFGSYSISEYETVCDCNAKGQRYFKVEKDVLNCGGFVYFTTREAVAQFSTLKAAQDFLRTMLLAKKKSKFIKKHEVTI